VNVARIAGILRHSQLETEPTQYPGETFYPPPTLPLPLPSPQKRKSGTPVKRKRKDKKDEKYVRLS